jgi:hypothetical protein
MNVEQKEIAYLQLNELLQNQNKEFSEAVSGQKEHDELLAIFKRLKETYETILYNHYEVLD